MDLDPCAVELCRFTLWLDAGVYTDLLMKHIRCGTLFGGLAVKFDHGIPLNALEQLWERMIPL